MTISITLDERTESALRDLSFADGADVSRTAARLLARAVRAATPRKPYDTVALAAIYKPFEAEDLALAESDLEYRQALLEAEDHS